MKVFWWRLVSKSVGNGIDLDTLILQKAEFQAGVEVHVAKEKLELLEL